MFYKNPLEHIIDRKLTEGYINTFIKQKARIVKTFITVKSNTWSVYRRDTIQKIELENDVVRVYWGNPAGKITMDEFYPKNAKQFFKKLMDDVILNDNEEKKNIEI